MSDDEKPPEDHVFDAVEVGFAHDLLDEQQRTILRESLLSGAPRALAARAAGVKNLDAIMQADQKIADDVDQCEALAEVKLLKLTAITRPLEVLARTRPRDYGPSVARPLTDEDGDDGINLDPD